MGDGKCEIGLIGLGTMGANFALNMADHGFKVAVYNRTAEKTEEFVSQRVEGRPITAGYSPEEFLAALRRPRAILLVIKAGKPVDAVLEELTPLLEQGDIVIDGGNSHFTDTDRRAATMAGKNLLYMGMGISGGEEGARFGPSIMPGGPREAYDRVKEVLGKAAAQVSGEPCVAYLGRGSAGHYVKMAHNGIEYAYMELIAETYDLMRRGLGLGPDRLSRIYDEWNRGELESFLLEITARIFTKQDPETGKPLVDMILDRARQKGTGKWTTDSALDLQTPTPTIDQAVMTRNLSTHGDLREKLERCLGEAGSLKLSEEEMTPRLKDALYGGLIIAFSQGMSLLSRASKEYDYGLNLEEVARIWRGGCIIRTALLEGMRKAYRADPGLENPLLDPDLGGEVVRCLPSLRAVVIEAARAGLPVPGFMSALAYVDALRSDRLPTNLVQAQRDFFGAHTYERIDREGVFHTEWQS